MSEKVYLATKSEVTEKFNMLNQSISSVDSSVDTKITEVNSSVDTKIVEVRQDISGKANKTNTVTATMSASGWSNGVYSFESTYPNSTYDITIEINGDSATDAQIKAWSKAKIVGSATENKAIAKGDSPTVDIPIIVKAVMK